MSSFFSLFKNILWGEDEQNEEQLKRYEELNLLILARADWLKHEFEKSKTILSEAVNSKKEMFSIGAESFICRMIDDYADFYRKELFLSENYGIEEYENLVNEIRKKRQFKYKNDNDTILEIYIITKVAVKMCEYYEKRYINNNANLLELSKEYLKNENKI